MVISFADGTKIEIAAAALDSFLQHDLKWVEFVHGSASLEQARPQPAIPVARNVTRCPSAACGGC
jgi:hypothetical protein